METANRRIVYFCAIIIALIAGCSRQQSETTSIGLRLPSTSEYASMSLTGYQPEVVIVNIHGEGMPPLYWPWENHCRDSGCTATMPNPIEIPAVPNGKRLIQLLLVFKHAQDESLAFRYGYANVDLVGGSQTVSIAAAQFGVSGGKEVELAGRFYETGSAVSTGNIEVRVVPPVSGQPDMIIERSAIFAGWLNGFAVQGINFKYVLVPQNRLLFTTGYNGTDVTINGAVPASSAAFLKVTVPDHYRKEDHFSSVTYRSRKGHDLFLGFFGPGVPAGYKTYYSTTSVTVPDLFETSTGGGAVTTETSLVPANCSGTNDNSTGTPLEVCVVGLGAPLGAPSPTDEFVNYVKFKPELLRYDTRKALGFEGPLILKDWGDGRHESVHASMSGADLIVQWRPIAGLSSGPSPITGFELLKKPESDWEGGGKDDETCHRLIGKGYVKVADKPLGTNSHTFTNWPASTGSMFAVCPYRTVNGYREYLNGASKGGYFKYGGGSSPATKLAIDGPSSVGVGACVEVVVRGDDGSGSWGQISSTTSVTVSTTGSIIYLDPNCSTGSSSETFSLGGNDNPDRYTLYLKSGTATPYTLTASGGSLANGSRAVNFISATAPAKLGVLGPSNIDQYQCMRYTLQLQDANGVAMPSQGALGTITFSTTQGNFYDDGYCSVAPTSSKTWNVDGAGETSIAFFFKTVGTTAPSFTTVNSNSLTNAVFNPSLQTAGPPAKLEAWAPSTNFTAGSGCIELEFELRDASGRTTAYAAAQNLTFSSDSSASSFYSASGCSPGGIVSSSVSWPAYTPRLTLWYEDYKAGTPDITVSISGGASAPGPIGLTVQAGAASQVIFILDGEVLNSGEMSFASAVPMGPGVYDSSLVFNVMAYAVDSFFNIDTSYSDTCVSGFSTTDPNDSEAPSPMTFTNGQLSFPMPMSSPGTFYSVQGLGPCGAGSLPVMDSNLYDRN